MFFSVVIFFLSSSHLLGFSINHSNLTFQSLKSSFQKIVDGQFLKTENEKAELSSFQEILEKGPIPVSERQFLVQGWRWHTISVIQDLERFSKLIKLIQDESTHNPVLDEKLSKCFNWVFDFNWKALMRVEREIFFPWLSSILPEASLQLVSNIKETHDKINQLTINLGDLCSSCSTTSLNRLEMETILTELIDSAKEIQVTQNQYLVPFISAYISKKDQSKFNRKVLSNLGLLNSQIHLVSMLEAIKDDPIEMKLFQEQIPSVARALVPLWRSQFYSPRTSCLDGL